MANEAEIQRLVVRLMGDASSYSAALNQAVTETGAAVAKIAASVSTNSAMNTMLNDAASAINAVVSPLTLFRTGITDLNTQLRLGSTAIQQWMNSVKQNVTGLPGLVQATNAFKSSLASIPAIATAAAIGLDKYTQALTKLGNQLSIVRISQTAFNQLLAATSGNMAILRFAQDQYNQTLAATNTATQTLLATTRQYAAFQANMQAQLANWTTQWQAYNQNIGNVFNNAAPGMQQFGQNVRMLGTTVTAAGAAITGLFGGLLGVGVKSAAEFEQTTVAFTMLLGSAKEAKDTLAGLVDFAAKTPFELPEVERAARTMILFGERGQELTDTLTAIGNAAAGSGSDLGEIALIFNQIRGVGHLIQQDFRQLAIRAVISLQDIANFYGVTKQEAQEMQRAQQVSFEDMKQMFKDLSKEGGRFANAMEIINKTLGGQWSNLKDRFTILLRDMGAAFMPLAKQVVAGLMDLITWFNELTISEKNTVAVILGITASFGVALTVFGTTLVIVGQLAVAFNALTTAALAMAASQRAVAGTLIATNVAAVGLATAGIALIVYGLYKAMPAVKDFNKALGETRDLASEFLQKESDGVSEMLKKMNSIKNPQERKLFDEGALKKTDEALLGLQSRLALTKKEVEKLTPHWWLSIWSPARPHWEAMMQDQLELEERIKKLSAASKALYSDLAGIKEKGAPTATEDDIKDAEEYLKKLELMVATYGMSKDASKLYELQLQNIDKTLIDQIDTLQRTVTANEANTKACEEAAKATEKLNEAASNHIQKLGESIVTFGMSTEAVKLWELQHRNAHPWVIAVTKALTDQKLALDNHKKMMDEGKKINEKYATPLEKLHKTFDDLTRLLNVGAIGQDTFRMAMAEARDEMVEAQNKAKDGVKVRFTVEGNDVVRKGSKESLKIMAETQQRALEAAQRFRIDWDLAQRRVQPLPLAEGGLPPGWKPPEGMVNVPMSNVAMQPPKLLSYEETKAQFNRNLANLPDPLENRTDIAFAQDDKRMAKTRRESVRELDKSRQELLLERIAMALEKDEENQRGRPVFTIEPLNSSGGGGL